MAELAPSTAPSSPVQGSATPNTKVVAAAASDGESTKRGRRSKFTPEEDIIILREVAVAGAHVPPYGKTTELFQMAANGANKNANFSVEVTWKSVHDRFHRLLDDFEKRDAKAQKMSGVSEDVGEAEELLSMMKEARDDVEEEKRKQRDALKRADEEKLQAGKQIVQMATSRGAVRKRNNEPSGGAGAGNADEDEDAPVKKKRNAPRSSTDIEETLGKFADALEKSDAARLEFDRERLAIELEQREKDRKERQLESALDREERKKEREDNAKLELEKFKLMLDVLSSNRNQ